MVTVCGVEYAPPAGEITGVAVVGMLIVRTDMATVLALNPPPDAMALTVAVALTVNDVL
jgi:hypothetical protein